MSEPEQTQSVARLGRRYHFSASHRLHAESLSEAENRQVFGKCNHPHGHGHNYVVELVVEGAVNRTTGMVYDLAALDRFARARIVDRFDHRNLNLLDELAGVVPTTENVAALLFEVCSPEIAANGARLVCVCVEETGNNTIEYFGEHSHFGRESREARKHVWQRS